MSGGSWNYAYARIDEAAECCLARRDTPERRAFRSLLKRCAEAARVCEWHDSGDYGEEQEQEVLGALLSAAALRASMLEHLREEIVRLKALVARAEELAK